jgi:hypothetical protein
MDVERIERALRDGPVDEPLYVPGSFRRPGRTGWSMAVVFASAGAALVLGVFVGLGLGVLRTPGDVGSPVDTDALAAQLEGRWTSEEMTRDEWNNGLVALGFDIDDVEAFHRHDPIASTVRYELEFRDGWLDLFVEAPPNPLVEMGDGPLRILPDGRIHHDDRDCFVTMAFDTDGDQLTFARISTESCGVEEQLANSAFFNLSTYTRLDGD